MKARVVDYTPKANSDLAQIFEFIAASGGAECASNFALRLRDFCERLEYGAERGHRRDDLRPGLRIVGFERRVTVAFAAEERRVTILRLFYRGIDWERERL